MPNTAYGELFFLWMLLLLALVGLLHFGLLELLHFSVLLVLLWLLLVFFVLLGELGLLTHVVFFVSVLILATLHF
jgi:hypothetical protein